MNPFSDEASLAHVKMRSHATSPIIVTMADRVMFVQLKTGHNTDRGPCWISTVRFNRSWNTATWHGKTLARRQGIGGNFCDVDTDEEYWLSGPHRDRGDTRYSGITPSIDEDARTAYEAFLAGKALPGRERG